MRSDIKKNNSETIKVVTEWVLSGVRSLYEASGIQKYAEKSRRPLKGVVAELWQIMESQICGSKEKWLRSDGEELYAYNGKYFERVNTGLFLKELVRRVLTELGVNSTYRFLPAQQIAKELADNIINAEGCSYEPDRRYICFENCIFDVKTGEVKKHSITYCTDLILDIPYKGERQLYIDVNNEFGGSLERNFVKLWEVKIKEIIPNVEFREAFQQFCGSLLIKRDELKVEYICYLFGSGANGKSVVSSAIANVFGERYYSTFTPKQLFKDGVSSMFNMSDLRGKILNLVDDMDGTSFDGGEFKRFISGEKFRARGVYSRDFTVVQPPLMLCCTNGFPDTDDDSYGHHRRQLVIETTARQFVEGERDPYLTAKLSTPEARLRIFHWIYEGYKKIIRNGGNIELGEEVKQALETRRALSSPMRRWVYDRQLVRAEPDGKNDTRWKSLKEWFKDFKDYCEANGCRDIKDSRRIAEMFVSLGFERERRPDGWHYCVGSLGVDTMEDGQLIKNESEKSKNNKK